MKTEFRKAVLPEELRSLSAFDRKVFPSDHFPAAYWRVCESYWMLVDDRKVGCSAFEEHVDFEQDRRADEVNPRRENCLYISSTGILPSEQGRGFGQLLKCWQLTYARSHGFTRIVTNTRKRNTAMIALNKKFGFRTIRTTAGYYAEPTDSTVVMELSLKRSKKRG